MKISPVFPGLLICLLLAGCNAEPDQTRRLSGSAMGTTYNITVVGEPAVTPAQITARLEAIEDSMSTYRENSELMRLNRAPLNTWVRLSPELFAVLELSTKIHTLSGGAFDAGIGALVNLWGFGPTRREPDSVPSDQAIDSLLGDAGLQYLELDSQELAVLKQRDIQLDLSGIAKGYAVDEIARLLDSGGNHDYLVEIGGEIRCSGNNASGQDWRIAIENPDSATLLPSPQRIISISDSALASSGNYRNFFEVDGRVYSHTIDPHSGRPVSNELRSVTVMAEDAATADALATAFTVLGPQAALNLANRENIPAYFLTQTEAGLSESISEAFITYMLD